jgi:hypothetical protein
MEMEPHGQSPWSPVRRPCGATSRPHDGAFLHGQRPWSRAAGIKKKTFLLFLMLMMLHLPLVFKSVQAEIYQWKDEKGTIHFTEDEGAIPEKYRDQIQKKHFPEESKSEGEKVEGKGQNIKEKKRGVPQKQSVNRHKIESDVMDVFRTIISLWKDGKYDALYEYGDRKSRMTVNKEDFGHRMANKKLELALSWETVNDIEVDIQSPVLVYTTAKIGYRLKAGGDTRFRTETYQMKFENGLWKINLLKILNAKR